MRTDPATKSGAAIKVAVDARMVAHSGIGTYLRNVVERLAREPDFELILMGSRDLLGGFPWFSPRRFIPLRSPIYGIAEQLELSLKVPACDVLWSPNFNVPLLPVRARRRLVTVHDAYHLTFADTYGRAARLHARMLFRRAVGGSGGILTVSDFSRRELVRHLGVREERVRVIPNGIDPAFAQGGGGKRPDWEYMLFVGNAKPNKNLGNALRAFQAIAPRFPELRFVIVGRTEGLRTPDSELGSVLAGMPEGRVILTGQVSDAELKDFYRHARLFIFPSLYEGFGLPLLEAMLFGIPVAASRIGPLPEVGGDAVSYFDPGKVQDIAETVCRIISDRESPEERRERYRAQLGKFSWERSATEHARMIRSLARG